MKTVDEDDTKIKRVSLINWNSLYSVFIAFINVLKAKNFCLILLVYNTTSKY